MTWQEGLMWHDYGPPVTWHDVDVSAWYARRRIWAVDQNPGYVTEWHCKPPADGATFTVTEEDWYHREAEADPEPPRFLITLTMPGGQTVDAPVLPRLTRLIPVRRIYAWLPKEPG